MLRVAKGGKGLKDEKVESRHSERSEESLLGQSAMIEILRLPLRMLISLPSLISTRFAIVRWITPWPLRGISKAARRTAS